MEISNNFVVYKLRDILDNSSHLALEEVVFKGHQGNSFNTVQEAINALVVDKKTYTEYIIVNKVVIRDK